MYPAGVGQLIEGWSKNFATGAAATNPVVLVLIVAWLSGCIAACWSLVVAPSVVSVSVYIAYSIQLWLLARRVGRFGVWAVVLFPVPLAFFLLVFVRSLVLTYVVRSVRWKGRRLPARSRPR
jgi:4,4'-diaponeurosporenoate glycosyltransferase